MKILVPIDFSACSESATIFARELAKQIPCNIHLIHVVDQTIFNWEKNTHYPVISNVIPLHQKLNITEPLSVEYLTEQLEIECNKSQKTGVESTYELAFGNVKETLKTIICDHQPAIIVLGSKGASGIKAEIIGSNALFVNKIANCPVFTIPKKSSFSKIQKAVFLSDFNSIDTPLKLFINTIVKKITPNIYALHINTPQAFNTNENCFIQFKKQLADIDIVSDKWIVRNHFSVEEGILAFAIEKNIDMIILVSRKHRGIEQWINFKTSEILLNQAKIPILMLPQD